MWPRRSSLPPRRWRTTRNNSRFIPKGEVLCLSLFEHMESLGKSAKKIPNWALGIGALSVTTALGSPRRTQRGMSSWTSASRWNSRFSQNKQDCRICDAAVLRPSKKPATASFSAVRQRNSLASLTAPANIGHLRPCKLPHLQVCRLALQSFLKACKASTSSIL